MMYSHSNPNIDIATVDPNILSLEGGLRQSNAPQHQIDALYQEEMKVGGNFRTLTTKLSFRLNLSAVWSTNKCIPIGSNCSKNVSMLKINDTIRWPVNVETSWTNKTS